MKIETTQDRLERLINACIQKDYNIEKLDEIMAPEYQIRQDTKLVGGFVSALNITETEGMIIERAIRYIRDLKAKIAELEAK